MEQIETLVLNQIEAQKRIYKEAKELNNKGLKRHVSKKLNKLDKILKIL
ncbi:hypothetical protein SAMN04489761_3028 [Tenacibaculum sp. MAR_2009_124]|nr:hypothetical protein [Tenacibaculum sp. MAR_2009_124]SEC45099.1 hypothetical protein SAMN04489761_3028 [Tenacibaculum sp. MAR_2009_124]